MKIDYRATYHEMSEDGLSLRLIELDDLVPDARMALLDELIARGYAPEDITAAIGKIRDYRTQSARNGNLKNPTLISARISSSQPLGGYSS